MVILIIYRIIFVQKELKAYEANVATRTDLNVTIAANPPLPFASYFPFSYEHGPAYYAAYVYQFFCTWGFGIYISGIDVILCGFLLHSKAQLLILRNYIGMFVEKAEEMFVSIYFFR